MAHAATTFLAALDPAQRPLATYPLTDAERENGFRPAGAARGAHQRTRWTTDQQALGLALLRTGLSHTGMARAHAIMALELVLKELEKDTGRLPRSDVVLPHDLR